MKFRTLVVVAILLVAVAGLGCGTLRRAQDTISAVDEAVQTAKEVAESVDTPGPDTDSEQEQTPADAEPGDAVEAEDIEVLPVDALDSYRQETTMRVTEDGETEGWTMMVEFVREPPASHMVWRSIDDDGETSVWEMIQIDTVTYMRTSDRGEPGEWMSMTSEDAQPPEQDTALFDWLGPSQYTDDEHCTQSRGRADVNGHPAVHFSCSKEVFGDLFGIWVLGGKLLSGSAEAWISTEYQVPVRVITQWEAEDADGTAHAMYMERVVSAINEPLVIEAPEGVAGPGLPDDIPLYPGARITYAMTGMASFEVEADIDDVMAYYMEEMVANGWDAGDSSGEMHTFSKNGRDAMLVFAEDGDTVTVTVMADPQ